MPVVLDTGFLSSLHKIGRLGLVKSCFENEDVLIPRAVYAELLRFAFKRRLPIALDVASATYWIKVVATKPIADERLGLGEREAIALAERKKAMLLIDDVAAKRIAQQRKVGCVGLASFLLTCKKDGLLDKKEMQKLLNDLKEKDFYEFSGDIKKLLLA